VSNGGWPTIRRNTNKFNALKRRKVICSLAHLFIRSPVHLFTCSAVHPLTRSYVHLLNCSSAHQFIRFICCPAHLFTGSSVYPFISLPDHPFIFLLFYSFKNASVAQLTYSPVHLLFSPCIQYTICLLIICSLVPFHVFT